MDDTEGQPWRFWCNGDAKASLEYIQYCIMGKMVLMKEENSFQMFAYEGKEKDKAVA